MLLRNIFVSILKLLLLFHLLLLSLHDQVNFLLNPLEVLLMEVLLLVKSRDRRLLLMAVILSYLSCALNALITLTTLTPLAALESILISISGFIPISQYLLAPKLFFDLF